MRYANDIAQGRSKIHRPKNKVNRIKLICYSAACKPKFGTVDQVMTKESLSSIYGVEFEIVHVEGKPLSVYY